MRVTIVSGPTSSGKSTLIRRLRCGEVCFDALPEVRNAVRVRAHSLKSERKIQRLVAADANLIVHYDILRPYKCVFVKARAGSGGDPPPRCLEDVVAMPPNYGNDVAFTLVRRADEACCITLFSDPLTLAAQLQSELTISNGDRAASGHSWHRFLSEIYRSDFDSILRVYRNWSAFVQSLNQPHWLYHDGEFVPYAPSPFPLFAGSRGATPARRERLPFRPPFQLRR